METTQPAYKENHSIVRENTFQAAYREALHRAKDAVYNKNMAVCCEKAGAFLTQQEEGTGSIELFFLNRSVHIALPSLSFTAGTGKEAVSIWEQILILHYLANSEQAKVHGELINYRRLRDGAVYAEAFDRRCIKPLVKKFGSTPDEIIKAADTLGGSTAAFGDYAVCIAALPRIDIICCLWKADADFEPEATILFDAGIEQFLCAEDIAVLCQQIVLKLIKK